jgi:cytochrome c-type biogenesis protein CcmH/NrfG
MAPAASHAHLSSQAQNLRNEPAGRGAVINQLLGLAQQCVANNRPAEALECYQAAVQVDPNCTAALVGLADTLASTGRSSLAVDCYLQALAIDPAHLVARVNLAALLRKNGNSGDAVTILRPLIDAGVDHPTVGFNFANALSDLGQFEEARKHYARVLPRHPYPARVFYNLAQISKFQEADRSRLTEWTAVANQAIGSDDDEIHLHFALGKALDDLGDYGAAWQHFAAGNNLVTTSFDPDAHDRDIDATIARFDESFLHDRAGDGIDSEQPVFIVGMPRSGTTLVEQILSAHPEVEARGERRELGSLIESRARAFGLSIPESAASLTPEDTRDLANQYLTSAHASAARFTDKMPFNFLHVGWIALLFPRARIIHVRRDPRAVCLSCYQQHFTERLPFAYRLEHLARYWFAYDRLMDHWRTVLPYRLCEVNYESIVASPQATTRQLLDHCGLDWDPACLLSHEQKGSVTTASQWQVRQPIYQSSRARWQHYAPHLGPFLESLGDSALSV